MAWTYGDDPINSTRDAVRCLVGDTDTTDQQITDEVIAYALSLTQDAPVAASIACRMVAAFYSRKADTAVDVLRFANSQKARAYLALALALERQASTLGLNAATPQVLGTAISAMQAADADTDRFPARFSMGMMDFNGPQDPAAGTGQTTPGYGTDF